MPTSPRWLARLPTSSITGERGHGTALAARAAPGRAGEVGMCLMEPSPVHRWLAYLLFFILVLAVCLLACLGLAKRSRCLLTT